MSPADDFRAHPEKELLDYAQRILQGEAATQSVIYHLARALKNRYTRFGVARKLLWLARSGADRVRDCDSSAKFRLKLAQQHALCTYKDLDLSAYVRFERARKILGEADLCGLRDDIAFISQESLGITGAIYKAEWEAFGQRASLYQSLACYERGWLQGTGDDGYTGLNAAFILDVTADLEEADAKAIAGSSDGALVKRKRAREVRSVITRELPGTLPAVEEAWLLERDSDRKEEHADRIYWLCVTLGEAYAGLGLEVESNAECSKIYYSKARELGRYDWMVESTARQLTSLTRLLRKDKGGVPTEVERAVIKCLVGETAPGVESAFIGRVGLALSGGGFRASLFHIGVLARLAELDSLRHVEYLSCVSGGSIIGAYYYLKLRDLLQSKTDDELAPSDYVGLVRSIEEEFLEGVQGNIRMMAISDYQTNLSHDILSGALPSERVADLYESRLYRRTGDLLLSDLAIHPCISRKDGECVCHPDYRPKEGNWRRKNKVPILILNATTLNTGHNWQFSATWMGEPPSTVNDEIDGNQRLRRMYYSEAPEPYKKFRLGRAVGASACVPALFSPVELPGLYQDLNLKLVDGGVHDNQGVASLIEQGCSVMLVSDASGQLGDQWDPLSRLSNTGLRADDIVQERIRVAQYQDLESRRRSGLLRSLMFIHLKKELELPPMDWKGCALKYEASDEARAAAERGSLTTYGINPEVQRALAGIRTDLDSFHETEAWALMTSGYQMTKFHLPASLEGRLDPPPGEAPWKFLRALDQMRSASPNPAFVGLLNRSGQRFFKAWDIDPVLIGKMGKAAKVGGVLIFLALACVAWYSPITIVAIVAAVALVLVIAGRTLPKPLHHYALAALLAWGATWYLKNKKQAYLDAAAGNGSGRKYGGGRKHGGQTSPQTPMNGGVA